MFTRRDFTVGAMASAIGGTASSHAQDRFDRKASWLTAQSVTSGASATPLSGQIYGRFSSMADGTPQTFATGQFFVQQPASASAGIVLATVRNGELVASDSGHGSTASYNFIVCKEDIQSMYADVSFTDSYDAVGLISTIGASQASIGMCSLHIVFTRSSYFVQRYTDVSGRPVNTTDARGNFAAVKAGETCRVGWRISGSEIHLLLPDGSEATVTSSAAALRTGHVACYEHYRVTSGTPGTRFYAVSANLFRDAAAAGRTNILVGRNDLRNSAWTKTLTGPQSGQPDADGGSLGEMMMETRQRNFQGIYQLCDKPPTKRRYSQRAKVKLIERDWMLMIGADGTLSGQARNYFNLSTQTAGRQSGIFTDQLTSIIPIGNGFYQIQQEFVTNSDNRLYCAFCCAISNGGDVYSGDQRKGMIIYDQQLWERPT